MGQNIREQAATWPTPDAQAINDAEAPATFFARQARQKAKGINGNGMGLPLAMAAKTWPTPAGRDGKNGDASEATLLRNSRPLSEIAHHWPTQNAADGANAGGPNQWGSLVNATTGRYSPQGPQTADGPASSPGAPTSRRRLNPAFVCWLMGWPVHWTSPVPISSAAAATAAWRCRLRRRLSSLCGG